MLLFRNSVSSLHPVGDFAWTRRSSVERLWPAIALASRVDFRSWVWIVPFRGREEAKTCEPLGTRRWEQPKRCCTLAKCPTLNPGQAKFGFASRLPG